MELDQLQQIIELLKREGLSEITVWEGDQRITVKREQAAGPMPAPPASEVAEAPPTEGVAGEAEDTFTLDAPLVGTFYRRASPDAEPFAAPGDVVRPGDTVCVIEAMKVMNEINAEEAGRVRRILVDDGDPVEYGQALLVFERL